MRNFAVLALYFSLQYLLLLRCLRLGDRVVRLVVVQVLKRLVERQIRWNVEQGRIVVTRGRLVRHQHGRRSEHVAEWIVEQIQAGRSVDVRESGDLVGEVRLSGACRERNRLVDRQLYSHKCLYGKVWNTKCLCHESFV